MLTTVSGSPKYARVEISGNGNEFAEMVNAISAGMRIVECSAEARARLLDFISRVERITQTRIHGKENEKIFTP